MRDTPPFLKRAGRRACRGASSHASRSSRVAPQPMGKLLQLRDPALLGALDPVAQLREQLI
jgi:hypothetical protein